SISVGGTFALNSGTIAFNGVTITGPLQWNNAFVTGSGLTIPSGSTLTIGNSSGTHILQAGAISNSGTVNCSAQCIAFRYGSTFTNNSGGNVNIAGDYLFGWDGNGNAGSITNSGTITKTGGTGSTNLGNQT